MSSTLVIQSHRTPLPSPWIQTCVNSVQQWAELRGYDYTFMGDELFDRVPPDLRRKTEVQPVVATDVARLLVMREALAEGRQTVIWCDADFLVFAPDRFVPIEADVVLGREVWVQRNRRGLRTYVKVHNAFMLYRQGNSFLDYYIHAAMQIVSQHEGPMVAQLVGPKLLLALHNMAPFPVQEDAAMLSPVVATELLDGQPGEALDLFVKDSACEPVGINICSSVVERGLMSDDQAAAVIEYLLAGGGFGVS